MSTPFKEFDLTDFWKDSKYAQEEYVCEPYTEEVLKSVETELGVKLPDSFLSLMRTQNGGIPANSCCPTTVATSWAEDHVEISGIFGIGSTKTNSLCGKLGSKFMQEEWGYPDFGICICDCPSAGHDMIMLDYRKCGPKGEPAVIHVDQEADYEITHLADNFEDFIKSLVSSKVYDTSEADLKNDLKNIDEGSFSTQLSSVLLKADDQEIGYKLRRICHELAQSTGHFTLSADEQSYLVYDLLFQLWTNANGPVLKSEYLKLYPGFIAISDGKFSTNGHAPSNIEDWFKKRIKDGSMMNAGHGGQWIFKPEVVAKLKNRLPSR